MARRLPSWQWIEAPVSQHQDHFKLFYQEGSQPVALIGRPVARVFQVQFLRIEQSEQDAPTLRKEVERELEFYLVKLNEDDPWKYARYHCGTAANIYSNIHWSYFPAGHEAGKQMKAAS